ncbi:UDP-glucose 4-epimerase [Halolactibacillus alkaliphilus]|uniref:UDP-glucose 4-epimerase n=1 Tax=Halolactibacillus alkaliphilus TaxID=442899 RepID=A0A511X4H0_9BACI|nr:UDP-glucose 4-epimerase GalE [Halolactibacillus alkaliphilus]GEN57847.1 UDP-glucose 4-epimerase [Halolactibacillus alkaliphilus]GGN75184.1 UDP-glucose 4-epimerase [Halolactibacillus alkaliphilus]SFP06404.1 UDP-glucose 4-epimerase [Halolactibacillus alkaliphilus]
MNILVTGGLGFIGSHTTIELIKNNHEVIIADNLINSKIEVLDKVSNITDIKPTFYHIDVTDEAKVEEIFNNHKIDGVIHFAGLKAVGESVSKPLEYYYNNLVSTMVLSKMCVKHGVQKFVFSSSATVYGDQPSPLKEDMELKKTTNPYGETKAMSERILSDTSNANPNFAVSLLRYFNPVGAHESGLIGEDPNGIPNNLMPFVTKVAKGQLEKLNVFGDDYDTIDGTGVRDYIHVVDLAKGHVKAIENLKDGVNIYNLGTGRGTSVLELVSAFMKVNNIDVPYEIVGRRSGDIAICYADASKAERELEWKAELTIEDMVRDAWKFEKNNI